MSEPKEPTRRRRRNPTAGFRQLPPQRQGRTPQWPTVLGKPSELEKKVWKELWQRPMAVVWAELNDTWTPAMYTRIFAKLTERFSARLAVELRQLDAKLGLSARAARNLRFEVGEVPAVEPVDDAKIIQMQKRVAAKGDT